MVAITIILAVLVGALLIDDIRMRMDNNDLPDRDSLIIPEHDSFQGSSEADDTELTLPPEALMEEYENALESVAEKDGEAEQ